MLVDVSGHDGSGKVMTSMLVLTAVPYDPRRRANLEKVFEKTTCGPEGVFILVGLI
jgi:hypothetical protein